MRPILSASLVETDLPASRSATGATLGVAHARARDVLALTKPGITTMVVCTAATGLHATGASVPAGRTAAMLVGTAMVVAAAGALNMYLERDVDARMERTANRPLPAGRLRPTAALALASVLAPLGLALLVLRVGALAAALAGAAFVVYVGVYTPLKRRSHLALYVGAISGALPPMIGTATASGRLDARGLALFALLFVWQVPHFLAIAIRRREDFARAGIRALPVERGERRARVELVAWAIALLPVSVLPALAGAGGILYVTVAALLGVGFVVVGLRGLIGRSQSERQWAKATFIASLIYLPSLLAALAWAR